MNERNPDGPIMTQSDRLKRRISQLTINRYLRSTPIGGVGESRRAIYADAPGPKRKRKLLQSEYVGGKAPSGRCRLFVEKMQPSNGTQ